MFYIVYLICTKGNWKINMYLYYHTDIIHTHNLLNSKVNTV